MFPSNLVSGFTCIMLRGDSLRSLKEPIPPGLHLAVSIRDSPFGFQRPLESSRIRSLVRGGSVDHSHTTWIII